MSAKGQGHSLTFVLCHSVFNNFKHLLIGNHWADWSQISCGSSMGLLNKILLKRSRTHDQDGHLHTVEQFSTNQTLGDILYPGFWLVENCSTVWCICCHWTLYPKINFQPMRTWLTHTQFRGMTVGCISFRWTCFTLHSVYGKKLKL